MVVSSMSYFFISLAVQFLCGSTTEETLFYLPFLTLGPSAQQLNSSNTVDDGSSPVINLPTTLPMGESNQTIAYVNTNGFVSFGTKTPNQSFLPVHPIKSTNAILIAPYWDDIDLSQSGHVLYDIINDPTDNLIQKVNTFLSGNQSLENFDTRWMLVVQWKDVCPYRSDCISTNTFQTVIANNGFITVAIMTYQCGSIQWKRRGAVIGYHVSDIYTEELFYTDQEKIVDVDCLNSPTSNWTNLIYYINAVSPKIYSSSSDQLVPITATVNLTCKAHGQPLPVIFWYKNNQLLSKSLISNSSVNAITMVSTLMLMNVSSSNVGSYICQVNNSLGSHFKEITLTISSVAKVTGISNSNTISQGRHTAFFCRAEGNPLPDIIWKGPHGIISNHSRFKITIYPSESLVYSRLEISDALNTDTGLYYCIASNSPYGNGGPLAIDQREVTLSVLGSPVLTTPFTSLSVAIGEIVTLTFKVLLSVPSSGITWIFTSGNTSQNIICNDINYCYFSEDRLSLTLVNVTVAWEGQYNITAVNNYGQSSNSISLHVQAPAVITSTSPQNVSSVVNRNISMNCESHGLPRPVLSWYKDEKKLLMMESKIAMVTTTEQLASGVYRVMSVLTIQDILYVDKGTYVCITSNEVDDGVVQSGINMTKFFLAVQTYPEVLLNHSTPSTYTTKDTVTLHCLATGFPPPKIEWFKDRILLFQEYEVISETQTESFLVIETPQVIDSGDYTCRVTTQLVDSFFTNSTRSITIYELASFLQRPHSITINESTTIVLNCSVLGYPIPSVLWRKVGDDFHSLSVTQYDMMYPNGTYVVISSLTISNATYYNNGEYYCSIKNTILGTDIILAMKNASFAVAVQTLPVVTFTDDIFVDKVGANLSIQVNITHDLPAVVPSGIRWFYKNVELIFLNNDKYSVTNDRQTLTVHTLQFTDEGSYTVVVTNIVGSVVSTIQVDVQAGPVITHGPLSKTTLAHSSISFSCSVSSDPIFNAHWTHNDAIILHNDQKYLFQSSHNLTTLVIMDTTLDDAGEYKCVVSNVHDKEIASALLRVQVPPVISSGPMDITVELTHLATFTCNATGFPLPAIQWWKFDGSTIQQLTDNIHISNDTIAGYTYSEIHFLRSSFSDDGQYFCSAKNMLALHLTVNSTLATLTVFMSPNITVTPKDTKALAGTTVTFPCTVLAKSAHTLQWNHNEILITNDTKYTISNDGTLTVNNVELSDIGRYSCNVTNKYGSISVTALLDIQVPSTFTYHPNGTASIAGSTITMSCVANGHPTPVITWLKNLLPLALNNITIFAKTHSTEDKTSSSLTLFNIQLSDAGNYSCVSSNHLVTTVKVLSEDSSLSVLYPATVNTTLPNVITVNKSSNITLKCNGTGLPLPKLLWYRNGIQIIDNIREVVTAINGELIRTSFLVLSDVDITTSGTYSCRGVNNVTNLIGVLDVVSIQVIVQVSPLLMSPTDSVIKAIHSRDSQPKEEVVINFNITRGYPLLQLENVHWSFQPFGTDTQMTIVPSDHYQTLVGINGSYVRLVIKNVLYSDSGRYYVIVSNGAGSNSSYIDVNVSVEADIKAVDSLHLSTQDRHSINMSCIADGIPAPSKIYWFRNKTLLDPTLFRKIQIISTKVPGFRTNISHDIQGLRSTLIISEPLYSIDNGDYVCIANNMIGTIARITDPYKLNIIQSPQSNFCFNQPCQNGGTCIKKDGYCNCASNFAGQFCEIVVNTKTPPTITSPPQNITAELNSRVILVCQVSGNPQPRVTWYKDDVIIADRDANEYSFTIEELSLKKRGFYHCVATNVIDGRVHRVVSLAAVVNIKGIIQYKASLRVSEDNAKDLDDASLQDVIRLSQELVDEVNNFVAGRILNDASDTSLFFIELLQSERYNSTRRSIPVIITIITKEGGSWALLRTVQHELQRLGPQSNIYIKILIRFDGCYSETITIKSPSGNSQLDIELTWPETNIGEEAVVPCPCKGVDLGGGTLAARRYCGGNFSYGGQWEEGRIAPCNFSDLSREICKLAELDAPERLQKLTEVTNSTGNFEATEVSIIASVLISSQDDVIGDKKLSETTFQVVNNIVGVGEGILRQSLEQSNTPARLLNTLETVTNHFPLSKDTSNITIDQDKFTVQVHKIDAKTFQGDAFHKNGSNTQPGMTMSRAFIKLPSDLLHGLNTSIVNDSLSITSIYHKTGGLFLDPDNTSDISTAVFSATLVKNNSEVSVEDLNEPVVIQLMKVNVEGLINSTCVFWNVSSSSWSDTGCRLVNETNSTILCECNHLTNFAAILDVSPHPVKSTLDTIVGQALNALSYIGIIISIFSLVMTIITYIASRKLRNSDHGQLLLNLCFALLGLYFGYIFALHSTKVAVLCAIAGAVLQYFLLVTFIAMAVEALNLYIKLVIVLGKGIQNYVIKAILMSWVTPILIVVFCFAPDYELYVGEHFCRAINIPFYIGTLVPFAIIYVFNWVMFIVIMVQLLKKRCQTKFKESYSEDKNVSLKQQLMIAVTLSVLFGLGWGIGLPAAGQLYNTPGVRDTFAALFIILTAFQGLFVFIMHCVRSQEARKEWKRWFYKATGKKLLDLSSSMANSSVIRRRNTNRDETSATTVSYLSRHGGTLRQQISFESESDEKKYFGKDSMESLATIEKQLDSNLDVMVSYPVPEGLDLSKAKELFPSSTSITSSTSTLGKSMKYYENPLESGLENQSGSTEQNLEMTLESPTQNGGTELSRPYHHDNITCSQLTNPLLSELEDNGVINDESTF